MSNSVVPNTYNTHVSNTRIPNTSVSSGSGSNSVNQKGKNNKGSNVQGRGGSPLNSVYGRPRVVPQVKSNPNNTANSKFNVAQHSLFKILGEYNEYLQQLNSQYGSINLIPAANKPAVNKRVENYQRRIKEANRIFGLYSPYSKKN